MTLINDTLSLSKACKQLNGSDFITIDTEFHRETTYWPELCLAQVSGNGEAWAVDTLSPGIDLRPLFDLLEDKKLLKVFHAGRQDIEIFFHLSGKIPSTIFDTQIASMVCGFGESSSYETLVKTFTSASLDKNSRFTDWRQRPLTERQIKYALNDVIHLRTVFVELRKILAETGREEWVFEEMNTLTKPETYVTNPQDAWKRLRLRSTDPSFIQVVQDLASWRETKAKLKNVPRGKIIKDDTLLAIASHPPKNKHELNKIRGLQRSVSEGPIGNEIIEIVKGSLAVPKDKLPPRPKLKKIPTGIQPTISLLKVLLKAKCEEHGVAQQLVASSADLELIASGLIQNVRAFSGWRKTIFGSDAEKIMSGEIAITANNKEGIILIPIKN